MELGVRERQARAPAPMNLPVSTIVMKKANAA
jgi:hypothetical protein